MQRSHCQLGKGAPDSPRFARFRPIIRARQLRRKADAMARTLALTVTLVLLGFAGFQSSYVTSGQSDFKTILDGTSLKGWDVVGNANWSVADGAVQASMGTGFLVTPQSYTDFQIC